jgi:hypothetical protein
MWNAASEDWHTTWAENDLRIDGEFVSGWKPKTEVLVLILEENMRKFKQMNKLHILRMTEESKNYFFHKMECKTRVSTAI